MLLIIFLGLTAKLTLVSGDCDYGSRGMDDFDFCKATGTWFVRWHSPNDIENKLDCVVVYYGRPDGNISLSSIQARVISDNLYSTVNGTITNWNSTGLQQNYPPPSIWSGWYKAIAIDYNHYKILKHCSVLTNQTYVYVSYRSQYPDDEIVQEVREVLQQNGIDISQLVEWPVDQCQQAESSSEGSSE